MMSNLDSARGRMTRCALAAAAALAFAAGPLAAGTITGLYNTGVNSSGTPLAEGASDPHYTLSQSADASAPAGNPAVVATTGPFPFVSPVQTVWLPNSSTSQWVSPTTNQAVGNTPGTYTYTTTFQVTGDPSTVGINGQWATDNPGTSIALNGQTTGISQPSQPTYETFHPFTITSGFVTGTNTLTFTVANNPNPIPSTNPNPTGLRVEMTPFSVNTVPEPGTLALAGMGVLGLAGYSWRRRLPA